MIANWYKTGYTFTPVRQTFNNLNSNQTQNFTSFLIAYSISGIITGADNVTATLSGDKTQSLIVDDGGNYSFTVEHGGNYTVTPSKEEYTFTPASQTFNNVTSNQTQNFTASEIVTPSEITMVSIPAGSFRMGDIQGGGDSNELPVHSVTIISFEMGKYEVTQEQYQSVMGENPSDFSGTNLPVEYVSWYDAVRFCNALSEQAGLTPCYNESTWECDFSADGFRLPTEAEWEYACRAGTETKYYTGNSESDLGSAGWYYTKTHPDSSNSSSKTHPVGQKTSNAFGLYDMHGNVWEWCGDWYDSEYYDSSSSSDPTGPSTGSSRVGRGGGFTNDAKGCRSALRRWYYPTYTNSVMGFRVVRRSFIPGPAIFTISYTVTGADGVTVTLSGDASDSQTVNDNGSYSFTVFESRNYTVTPSKDGYTFTPSSKSFTNVTSDQTQNFTAETVIKKGKIAFSSDRDDGKAEIYVMDTDGSNLLSLTNNPDYDYYPSWSPDGAQIVYMSRRDGNYEIYVMDADGSNPHNITNNPADDYYPSWSPDGAQIAFSTDMDGNDNGEIYVIDTDGSNLLNLTNHPDNDWCPSWSPDGSQIAFRSHRDGNVEIYVMDADGSNPHNITNNPADDYYPSWSPDGSQIAFGSDRDG